MKTHQLAALLWLVSSIGGQTLVDVRTQTKNVDFSSAASTIPAKSGSALPASCKLGEMFFNTANAPGQNLYTCAPANSWTLLAGGGSSVGTVLSGNSGQFAYYGANGATVGGHTLVAGDIPALSYLSPMSLTGTGSKTASSTGTLIANDCAKWDANGNVIDAGAPCSSGSGSGSGLTAPATTTVGNVPQFGNSTGSALTAGLGLVTSLGTPGSDSNIPTEKSVRSAISATGVLQSSSHIAEGDSITAGFEACGVSNSTNLTCDYATLLGSDEHATVTDRGISQSQACDMVDNQTILSDLSTIDNNPIYTMMIGTNDANSAGAGPYEAIFQGCHKAAIAWIAVATKYAANSANCLDTGTWAPSVGWALVGEQSSTNGSTKTCTLNTFGGPLYAWYFNQDANGGTFTYTVDGGSATSISTATIPAIFTVQLHKNYSWNLLRIPGLIAGPHTIKFTVTSATSASNLVAIAALGTSPAQRTYGGPRVYVSGVPKQNGDANSAATAAYNADALADVALLAGDGLGVYFVNVRNYLCTSVLGSTCYNSYGAADMMADGLHPNQQGHIDLKQAFEQTEQFTPYVSTNYDASGAAAAALATSLQKANNLSDLASAASARINLGLGTAATQATSSFQSPLTFTGIGSQTVSGTGAGASGNCAKWDSNGNIVDAGAPCGSGSGGSGSSSWSSLTSGTNTSGAFILGSGASLAIAGSGTIAATSVPAGGISGILAAATLPNPTAATLGGVQSLAPTTHQWINTISTSGVPSSTQPAFSDVSGLATDAQLPSDQCTLTKYTVTSTDSALTGVSSPTPTKTLFTLPSTSTRICLIEIAGTASFTGISGLTAATVRLQSSAATPLLYSPNQDIFGTVGPATNNYWTDSGNTADRTAPGVVAAFTFTCSAGACNSSGLSAGGNVYITVGTRTMP